MKAKLLALVLAALPLVQGGSAQAAPYEDAIAVNLEAKTVEVTAVARDHMAGDGLMTILNQACSEPVLENGEIVGFRLFEIDKDSIFDLIGIRDGDVVTEIADVPLDSPQTALKLLQSIRGEESFTFTLRRHAYQSFGPPVRYRVRVT